MNVARILKDKGREVATVTSDRTLMDVVNLLAEKKIGAVVACDSERRLQGIVSERDIVRVLATNGPAAFSDPIESYMTTDVQTCTANDTVEWLMEVMTTQRFRHMPVVEGGKIIGIVSIGDVVKQRIAIAQMEADSMRQYIATG
ncbi:MAG: CBS domain-containing protein [Rhodomicrobiaceae bacterium]